MKSKKWKITRVNNILFQWTSLLCTVTYVYTVFHPYTIILKPYTIIVDTHVTNKLHNILHLLNWITQLRQLVHKLINDIPCSSGSITGTRFNVKVCNVFHSWWNVIHVYSWGISNITARHNLCYIMQCTTQILHSKNATTPTGWTSYPRRRRRRGSQFSELGRQVHVHVHVHHAIRVKVENQIVSNSYYEHSYSYNRCHVVPAGWLKTIQQNNNTTTNVRLFGW